MTVLSAESMLPERPGARRRDPRAHACHRGDDLLDDRVRFAPDGARRKMRSWRNWWAERAGSWYQNDGGWWWMGGGGTPPVLLLLLPTSSRPQTTTEQREK